MIKRDFILIFLMYCDEIGYWGLDILPALKGGDSYCGRRCSANPLRRVLAADLC